MMSRTRRSFLSASAATSAIGTLGVQTSWLPNVQASELQVPNGMVQFRPEIEPLVRLLEDTPRQSIVDTVLAKIKDGVSYRELLAALFLAGIRNVQPRPAVGFKFHSVLVVHAAHQASMAATDQQRWLPLLWSIDYFKSAQATDISEGDWTMAAVDETRLPEPSQAYAKLDEAMAQWDAEKADAAAAAAARVLSTSSLLDLLAKHAARDFRSIGHKSIYVAGAFRTLSVIGWEHAEPVIRSLAYAILNHVGEDNPANRDAEVDRAGRANWELVPSIAKNWGFGKRDPQATLRALEGLRTTSPTGASLMVKEMLNNGVHPSSIYDAIFLASSELVTRQPAIVPLHAVTTSNAMHYLFQNVKDESIRLWLLLQNASFLAHFRDAAKARGDLQEGRIEVFRESLQNSHTTVDIPTIFDSIRANRKQAAEQTLQFLSGGGSAVDLVRKSREFVFLKGTDSHDYKFSSACLEDYQFIAPEWRDLYLAGCTYLLHGNSEKTTPLAKRVLEFSFSS